MAFSLGLDIGSVMAKLALIDDANRIIRLDSEKIISNPTAAVNSLIGRLGEKVNLEQIVSAGVSGSGKGIIPEELNWAEYGSPLSIAAGLLHCHSDAKTIIAVGGQSSLVIELKDGLTKPWQVASTPLCAVGTGRFLEQQAYRLGISLDDFGRLALEYSGSPLRIAARCSVFAKTDLIHLQQKGTPLDAMLYSLCESVARMVASLKKDEFLAPLYFVGGVAANKAIARSLCDVLSAKDEHQVQIVIPENYLYTEALGSALLSTKRRSQVVMLPETHARQCHLELPGLKRIPHHHSSSDYRIETSVIGYLGVDVGSTSTKAVIIDQSGRILAKNYLMTVGKPVDAVKEVFKNLLQLDAHKVRIAGVGVTGSGRYLIGSFIGADLVKNEITAQTRAIAEIDAEADIIEIGGQDSKLVIKKNGVVVDYQMNKACAAGTGSFIDELAQLLGVSVSNGDFAALAFKAPYTIDLGSKCTAFTAQAVALAQQEGISLEVITASLANSIAKNYLSKVVGPRKLGNKIILTGAVFYNQAIISAFHGQLEGKTLDVSEHREVSGAIGVALLAQEEVVNQRSKFKGFQKVIGSECVLSTFTCKACEDNCTITQMRMPNEKSTFYGSRCDRYDSQLNKGRIETSFDERGKLLFQEHKEDSGIGSSVGIPRALLMYDYAPLIIGFLNALNVRIVLSGQTTKEIIQQAVQLSHTDSCFPLKLLHGHAAKLDDLDYILFPCAIRLGKGDGNENQKYACPLIQASPFIIRQALNLGERLVIPTIDFIQGSADTINSLADAAVKMGFSRSRGKKAAMAGTKAQQRYEENRAALGRNLLKQLHESDQLGVVIFARSYMSQDSGANLGIAEILAKLGVVPIPLDYLPLDTVDPKEYSDRPYWFYESKHIAAAAITANDPQLYGLMVTNFGCGPNSFIVKIVEDIMGGKPLGQLEIDEHAAEAGIVTRLEAFVDTIKGFTGSGKEKTVRSQDIYRGVTPINGSKKTLLMTRMAPHVEIVAAAMNAYGTKVLVLPESDQRSLHYSNQLTSGMECLPYRITLGDFMKFYYDDGVHAEEFEGFMAGAYGPCRFGKYAIEQSHALKAIGFHLPIRTAVSNNAYRDLNLGRDFERLAWKGIVAMDCLERLVWRTRPYEKQPGSADQLFTEYSSWLADCIRRKGTVDDIMRQATNEFKALIDPEQQRKPLIGINGEIYLRSNRFSNNDLVRVCENAGLEVIVSPMGEWFRYVSHRSVEDALRDRKLKKIIVSHMKKLIQEHDEHSIARLCRGLLDDGEPTTADILANSSKCLPSQCSSEAVLSIGSGIRWMQDDRFAGVISVMPHGCMPGGIVAAMLDKFGTIYQKQWISLTYDGFAETNNLTRINNFAEVIRFCNEESQAKQLDRSSLLRT